MSRTSPKLSVLPTLGALGAVAVVPLALASPAFAQNTGGAEVRVLHGIPGTPVDVYVDGELALDDFEPGTTTEDLALAAGSYEVAVFGADAPDDSGDPVIGPVDLDIPASGNVSAIAHLGEDGTPTITPYVNDTSATAAGEGRVVVRHTAAAPPVDVLVGGEPALTGISNPNEQSAELPVGTISAAVAAAGTTEPLIGPVDVPVVEGESTIVYAIGSLDDDSLDVLVQSVPTGGGAPAGVPAGTGGMADEGVPAGVLLATGLGLVAVAGGAASLARARR